MTHTNKVLGFVKSGLKAIKTYALFPYDWACGKYDTERNISPVVANHTNLSTFGLEMGANAVQAIGYGIFDSAVNCCRFCLCMPCCCIASAVTIPTGAGAALIFSSLGIVGTGVAAPTDIPECCLKSSDQPAPQDQTMEVTILVNPETNPSRLQQNIGSSEIKSSSLPSKLST